MTVKQFKAAMCRGLGRCVSVLQSCNPKERERYRRTVLWGCLHNLAFDPQCEGSRADYLYRLISCFPDPETFADRIAAAYKTDTGRNTWFFMKLTELLTHFAADGNRAAGQALSDKYGSLYASLLTKRSFRGYDYKRDNFEILTICLLELNGKAFPEKLLADYGALFMKNPHYDLDWFNWFAFRLVQAVGQRRLERELKKRVDIPAFARFMEEYEKCRETAEEEPPRKPEGVPSVDEIQNVVESGDTIPPYKRVRFSRRAAEEDRKRLAELLEQEPDPEKKAVYLPELWHGDYPGDHSLLAAYATSECEALASAAREMLTYCRSEAAYRYGRETLSVNPADSTAIEILLMNYRPADKALLLSALDSLTIDYEDDSDWHGVTMQILNVGDRGVRLPREFFLWIYEHSLCSCCRESAVRHMGRRRWLTEEMKAECRNDSNDDIVGYVTGK